jgi:Na+/H+ antiporter NhaA
MTATGPTDRRIGVTIALGGIVLTAVIAMAMTAGTSGAGHGFAVATIAGSLLVLALHAYPTVEDGH